ncbi:SDR family NAD(P)-dependent oxidoreductase [Mucilaginibacter sp. E4BP6]|uniref:SDR family NAD(P)-dependent oxidoreductase n=1 Tax=Mucilaginibacter sp. E4BP6 TaxID=2723089 RepID=UPI0015CEBBEA|nr:SDR family NAD(P)-dependent oxidoreductase [Mucilaginibacter sp. E4BP6]NYE68294.1 3-oxoacyl-(acyl-carrier-protein) synthase/NAD(P)-dependent dehydrogenase (short-subunit alcohol dehydrogenase family)/acyl carrier protein [Mucilaginibacter sp. E4BP6]
MKNLSNPVVLSPAKDVAIIGLSCNFPGARNLEAYLEQLKNGTDWVRQVSDNRLFDAGCDVNKSYRQIGFLEEIDKFDHGFFGISKSEAEAIDPVQRIMLEMTYTALEDAGLGPNDFRGEPIGVFFGGIGSSYHSVSLLDSAVSVIGNTNGVIAGRVAYALDLRGGALMIDTTCSSALVAVNEAYQKIITGDMHIAIAGSLNIQMFFAEQEESSPLNTMSPDGKCKPFDAEASGIGSGEGGGVIVLKRLDHAIADGDQVYAVIKGAAVNSDGGLSNGLTAPSPEAQKNVILSAWAKSDIDPAAIGYVEAHGTGTKLGDPIEFQALTEAFKFHNVQNKSCALGAVKSNLGHLDHAAGMAGLFKLICGLKYGKLFATLNFNNPNPFLDYENSALYVNTEYRNWTSKGPRLAAISSFGLSGTNIHMILEEFRQPERSSIIKDQDYWLRLSAKNLPALTEYRRNLSLFLRTSDPADAQEILHALNSSRGDYEYRLSIRCNSLSDLIQKCENDNFTFRNKGTTGITLLLSNAGLPKEFSDYLTGLYPDIANLREKILQNVKDECSVTLADQLTFLIFLDNLKIKINRIVATGIGRISQRIYYNRTLFDNINEFIKEGVHLGDIDQAKLRNVSSALFVNDNEPLLLSLSDDCSLAKVIKESQNEPLFTNIFTFTAENFKLHDFFEILFINGLTADLKSYGRKAGLSVKPAPTYPFQRVRCWFATSPESNVLNIETKQSKLFISEWVNDGTELPYHLHSKKVYVYFAKSGLFSNKVKDILGVENIIITVKSALIFRKVSETWYEIDSTNADHYSELYRNIKHKYEDISGIIDDSGYVSTNVLAADDNKNLTEELISVFFIAKVFHEELSHKNFGIYIATLGLHDSLAKQLHSGAARDGFWKGILSDHPSLDMHLVDFEETADAQAHAVQFCKEISTDHQIRVARYEAGIRNILSISPLNGVLKNEASSDFEKRIYLVTGGLGKIGRHLCKKLSETAETIIIIGQSDYKEDKEKLSTIDYIEKAGVKVDYQTINLADSLAMEQLFCDLRSKYKKVHRIYHLAGVADDFTPISKKNKDQFIRTVSPKLTGTLLLKKESSKLKPDTFVIFSSLNAVIPKKFSFDYAAANAFEDHLAFKIQMQGGTRYVSLNWPGWDVFPDDTQNTSGINPLEGIKLMEASLLSGRANIIISAPADFAAYRINPFFRISMDDYKSNGPKNDISKANENIREPQIDDSVESTISSIWQEVLKADSIDPSDDFFDIGGHSLNGTQVLNRINKKLGVNVDMDEFFDYGTLRSLSDLVQLKLDGLQDNDHSPKTYSFITPLAKQTDYAISDIQRTFWLNTQLQENSRIYNLVFPFFIKCDFQIDVLKQTMDYLLRRHESMRTSFRLTDGEIRQFIIPANDFDFKIRHENGSEELSWDSYAQHEHDLLFNIEQDPLVRASLVTYRADNHLFVLTMHHLVADGWSHGVLLQEFILVFKSYLNGQEPILPPLNFQYKDYVAWLAQKLLETGPEDASYWRQKLTGEWPMLLPKEIYSGEGSQWKAGTRKITLSHSETLALKTLAKQQDVTVFMVLISLIKAVIHQTFHWNDIVIGTVTSGRIHPELENQIGNYLNTLAIRDSVSGDMTFIELLKQVRQTTLEAFKHQTYPFSKVVEQKMNDGASWRERWLDIQVNLHNYLRVEDHLKGAADLFEVPEETANYDHDTDWSLHFNCLELDKDILSIYINYSRQMFDDQQILRLETDLVTLIRQVPGNPAAEISAIYLLDPAFTNINN